MSTVTKDEEVILNRFVEFLKINKGIEYQKFKQDVPNRNGTKNLDYFLNSSEAQKIALEIKSLNDKPEYLGNSKQFEVVYNELEPLIVSKISSSFLLIHLPYSYPMTMKQLRFKLKAVGQEVAQNVLDTAKELQDIGQEEWILTKLGLIKVEYVSNESGICFTSSGDRYGTAVDVFNYILSFFQGKISVANEQLDINADSRVLLITNRSPLIPKDMLIEAADEFFPMHEE